jgi:hypothetical protein
VCGSQHAGGGAAADVTAWCEFHNGVASGLKIAPYQGRRRQQRQQHQQAAAAKAGGSDGSGSSSSALDWGCGGGGGGGSLADSWLPHSKPAVPNYAHAGVLLALGLTGHLDRLSWTDLYRCLDAVVCVASDAGSWCLIMSARAWPTHGRHALCACMAACLHGCVAAWLHPHATPPPHMACRLCRYLSDQHDATTIAVLLGMSACCRGAADSTVARMLFLHLPARHPNTFPEIEMSPHVQVCGVCGVCGVCACAGCVHQQLARRAHRPGGRCPSSHTAHTTHPNCRVVC